MHKSTNGFDFWNKEKDTVIDMYLGQKMSSNQIAKHYECDPSTIISHLKRWNIERRKERANSQYNLDINFFSEIDSEAKAYFMGLLLADGHISKNNVIMLTLKDVDVIEKYKVAICSDAPIKIDRNGNHQFNIVSKQMSDDLRNIGFHNQKSYYIDINKVLSYVPKNLEHHFVRGLFDGDGSIKHYKYDYIKNPQLHFGYTGLPNVVDYVKTFLNIKTKTVIESDITHTCVTSCRQTIERIFDILYKDATIYMERKYNTFTEIIQKPSTTIMGGTL